MRSRPEAGSTDQDWGERGRRTWLLLTTTAPSKRSSAALTISSTSGVLLPSFAFSLRDFQVGSCLLSWQNPTKQERYVLVQRWISNISQKFLQQLKTTLFGHAGVGSASE